MDDRTPPADLSRVRTYPLAERSNKVRLEDFGKPVDPVDSLDEFVDGLPNVLMEAQSQGLPCVATAVSGIPELIEDGVTGLLVPPRDRDVLARGLARLAGDPALRARLGEAGRERTLRDFALERGIDRLVERFDGAVVSP